MCADFPRSDDLVGTNFPESDKVVCAGFPEGNEVVYAEFLGGDEMKNKVIALHINSGSLFSWNVCGKYRIQTTKK